MPCGIRSRVHRLGGGGRYDQERMHRRDLLPLAIAFALRPACPCGANTLNAVTHDWTFAARKRHCGDLRGGRRSRSAPRLRGFYPPPRAAAGGKDNPPCAGLLPLQHDAVGRQGVGCPDIAGSPSCSRPASVSVTKSSRNRRTRVRTAGVSALTLSASFIPRTMPAAKGIGGLDEHL
jgi:hypothetical protein